MQILVSTSYQAEVLEESRFDERLEFAKHSNRIRQFVTDRILLLLQFPMQSRRENIMNGRLL